MASPAQEHDPLPIPNGWFAVGWSHELREGEVRPVSYFDQQLVLFRTRSGAAAVLDAHCPHLGAHLGHGGRVMGETIRCPFHGWQWDATSGACHKIPYCERIPAAAKTRSWPVQEKNGMVFVWHHADGAPPQWDFPALPEIGSPDWTEPRTLEVEIGCHVQDAHENNNDAEHFFFVHKNEETPVTAAEISEDGRHYRMVSPMSGGGGREAGGWELSLVRDSWGLGLTAVRMRGIGDSELLLFASTTPIDTESCVSRWLLTCSHNLLDTVGEEFMDGITNGVQQDLPIWGNKIHRANPTFCEADGMLADFRRWAKQFYS